MEKPSSKTDRARKLNGLLIVVWCRYKLIWLTLMVIPVRSFLATLAALLLLTFTLEESALAEKKCEAAGFVQSAGEAYDRAWPERAAKTLW